MGLPEQTIIDFLSKRYGIKVHHIILKTRKDSHLAVSDGESYRPVPFLGLCIYESSFEKACKNRAMGLADEEIAEQVRGLVRDSDMEDAEKKECYDREMYIGVHSWDECCYHDFVYNHKPEIQKSIYEILPVEPKYVWACSKPGVNIVYTTEDYVNNSIEKYEKWIAERVLQIADDFVLEKYGERLDNSRFTVKIWNPDMPGYSAYGLSRQD